MYSVCQQLSLLPWKHILPFTAVFYYFVIHHLFIQKLMGATGAVIVVDKYIKKHMSTFNCVINHLLKHCVLLINARGLKQSVTELYILLGLICLQSIYNSFSYIKCYRPINLFRLSWIKKVQNGKNGKHYKTPHKKTALLNISFNKES